MQTLAAICHRLDTTQASGAPELEPKSLLAGVHSSIQGMESRMEGSWTERAATLATAIDRLNAGVAELHKTFSQASRTVQAQGEKKPKTSPPPPKAIPEVVLTQAKLGGTAELKSKANTLES